MAPVVAGLVSTVIPVRNRPRMVREAIASVLEQTYRPIEVIVCDDGSTDDTAAAVEATARERPGEVRLLRLSHRGQGPAREAGRLVARGEFIQYLDSDDLLRPRKFEVQVGALRERPDCGVAYGFAGLWREGGPRPTTPHKWTGHTLPTLFPWLLVDRWWTTVSPLYRRAVCDAVGPWTDLRMSEDWEYDGRVGALGTRLVHCREFVCDQRYHDEPRLIHPPDWLSPERLVERARFLGLLLGHARRAGVSASAPEMQHFSRHLFLTARQLAVADRVEEARECLAWAKEAAGPEQARAADYRTWDFMVRLVGWRWAGRLAQLASRLRPPSGSATQRESWMAEAKPLVH
jgi:glycosyltransferase involved in cell wall biosynthesis